MCVDWVGRGWGLRGQDGEAEEVGGGGEEEVAQWS